MAFGAARPCVIWQFYLVDCGRQAACLLLSIPRAQKPDPDRQRPAMSL
ncbi:MAG: hypothetical protein AB1753_06305 [Thermoproteota archaeon]